MGAYDEEKHPWLVAEKEYLRQTLAAGKKILGLCLGCQLLADALGGKAFRQMAREALKEPGVAPPASPYVQSPEEILSDLTLFDSARERFFAMIDRFAG